MEQEPQCISFLTRYEVEEASLLIMNTVSATMLSDTSETRDEPPHMEFLEVSSLGYIAGQV